MEDRILDEVDNLSSLVEKNTGQAVSLDGMLNISVINALWSITVGETLKLDDPKPKRIGHLIEQFNRESGNLRHPVLSALPSWLLRNKVARKLTKFDILERIAGSILSEIINPVLEKHAQDRQFENADNFMDAYMAEMEKCSDPASGFYKERGLASLRSLIIDLFIAGTGTTSTSLIWSILYMLHNQEVKQKVHEEIDEVSGINM